MKDSTKGILNVAPWGILLGMGLFTGVGMAVGKHSALTSWIQFSMQLFLACSAMAFGISIWRSDDFAEWLFNKEYRRGGNILRFFFGLNFKRALPWMRWLYAPGVFLLGAGLLLLAVLKFTNPELFHIHQSFR